MNLPSTTDVLVVGAGPGGSACATHLARAGVRVVAIDRAQFPRDKPCSEYMSPEAVRLLDQLGILQNLERSGGTALRGTKVVASRGASLTGVFAQAGGSPFRATGLAMPRRILDHQLVIAARDAGAAVVERTTLVDLLYERGAVAGAVVRRDTGRIETIHARLTIGADGLRSLVARKLGHQTFGFPKRSALVAHVMDVAGLTDTAELHVGEHGYVGMNPLGAGLANVALVIPHTRLMGARGRLAEFFAEALDGFPGVRGRVPRDRIVRPILATGPFSARASRVVANGALLLGDAADFFDPFTGEGIYSALRGAGLASATVTTALGTQGPITERQLAPYRRARQEAFRGKWVVERLIGYGMLAPRLFDRAVARLNSRGLGHTFIGVTGDFLPPGAILNPAVLLGMIV